MSSEEQDKAANTFLGGEQMDPELQKELDALYDKLQGFLDRYDDQEG